MRDVEKTDVLRVMRVRPLLASVGAGLVASLCCGGSIVFASLGLGLLFGGLGLWRFVPQVLALGALSIVAINYLTYRHAASRIIAVGGPPERLRASMFESALVGLVGMAASFVLLEWLNHGLVHPEAFLSRPLHGGALIPGVPNDRVACATLAPLALALLWALPFPGSRREGAPRLVGRIGVALAGALLAVVLAVDTAATLSPSTAPPHTPITHVRH